MNAIDWSDTMMNSRFFFWVLMTSLVGLTTSQQVNAETRRVVNLGVYSTAQLHEGAQTTLSDALDHHLRRAAKTRDFEIVAVEQSNAVLAEAPACKSAQCRQDILKRLKASHLLVSYVEPCPKGYCASVFIEANGHLSPLAAQRVSGSIPALAASMPESAERLLEKVSSEDDRQREKFVNQARTWQKRHEPMKAIAAYKKAIALNPLHPNAAIMQMRIINVLLENGEETRASQEYVEALELYGPKSAFSKSGIGGPHTQETIQEELIQHLLEKGTVLHHQAEERTEDDEERQRLFGEARRSYELFISHFAQSSDAPLIQFYLGEILYEQKEYLLAAEAYGSVQRYSAAHSASTLDAMRSQELQENATVATVYALERAIEEEREYSLTSTYPALTSLAEKRATAQEIPRLLSKYTEAVDELTMRYPKHPDAAAFAYRAAVVKLNHGYLLHAERRFKVIVEDYPKSAAAQAARSHLRSLS